MLLIALRRRDLERNVRGLESGDLVLVWILGIGFVEPFVRCKSSLSGPWLTSNPSRAKLILGAAGSVKSARNTPFHKAPPDIALTSCT